MFDSAYAAGSALTIEKAAAVALAVEHPDLAADPAGSPALESPARDSSAPKASHEAEFGSSH